jgi:hypothetical protein
MKRFNRQIAVCIFLIIAAYDAFVLLAAAVLPTGVSWRLSMPWWSVNFAGLPLFHLLAGHVPQKWCVVCLLIGIGLVSALLWSAIAGYVFRRKRVA